MIEMFNSSIGKKLIMSITGLFLMVFLLVHLTVNMLLLVGDGEVFNRAAHFMGSNPAIKVIEPLLAIGFAFHIIYATYLTIKNQKTRPIGYTKTTSNGVSTWSSKNMYILGITIFIFLAIHLANFFWKLKFGTVETITYGSDTMPNAYALVSGLFISSWWYDLLYVIGAIFLGLHLSHGFWAAFQTLGWNGTKWLKRLEVVAYVYAIIIGTGFSIIPIYFLLFK